jgi:hypothetical protein
MRTLNLAVKLRCPGFDIDMPYASIFYMPVVAQVQFSDNLFEVIVFLLEIHHFITAGLTNGIPG